MALVVAFPNTYSVLYEPFRGGSVDHQLYDHIILRSVGRTPKGTRRPGAICFMCLGAAYMYLMYSQICRIVQEAESVDLECTRPEESSSSRQLGGRSSLLQMSHTALFFTSYAPMPAVMRQHRDLMSEEMIYDPRVHSRRRVAV